MSAEARGAKASEMADMQHANELFGDDDDKSTLK